MYIYYLTRLLTYEPYYFQIYIIYLLISGQYITRSGRYLIVLTCNVLACILDLVYNCLLFIHTEEWSDSILFYSSDEYAEYCSNFIAIHNTQYYSIPCKITQSFHDIFFCWNLDCYATLLLVRVELLYKPQVCLPLTSRIDEIHEL